jgi:hypothetical protein
MDFFRWFLTKNNVSVIKHGQWPLPDEHWGKPTKKQK